MNFFGHAVVALRLGHGSSTVLGAMLPDLAGMVRVRLRSCADGDVAEGIELHKICDAVFHREPGFTRLVSRGRRQLEALGLRSGPGRAVAHVGIELLLDGVLGADREAVGTYREALEASDGARVASALGWDSAEGGRLQDLRDRLAAAPLPEAYRDPVATSVRLEGVLQGRPRLALRSAEVELVRDWLTEAGSAVAAAAEPLLGATLDGIRNTRAASPRP